MSQLDSITEKLGDHEFEIFKLDPIKSLEALNVVKDALAPALGAALGTIEGIGEISKLLDDPEAGGKLGASIERLLTAATFDRQRFLIDTFVEVTRVNGQPLRGQFDLIFRGDIPLMFSWMKLAFRGEWGNLVRAIKDGIGAAIARAGFAPKSRDTSSDAGQSTT